MHDEITPKSTPKPKRAQWLWMTLTLIVVAGVFYLILRQMLETKDESDTQPVPEDQQVLETSYESDTQAVPEEPIAEPDNPSTPTTTYTGSECESTLATYCAPLQTGDWMTWCSSQIEAWRAVGVEAINPCANSKYAKDSCTEAAILGDQDVPQACLDYHTALNTSSADVRAMCLYTTRPGGVCVGVKPAPVVPGTKPEDVVVPLDDCLRDHYDLLTIECQDAYDLHKAVSKSITR